MSWHYSFNRNSVFVLRLLRLLFCSHDDVFCVFSALYYLLVNHLFAFVCLFVSSFRLIHAAFIITVGIWDLRETDAQSFYVLILKSCCVFVSIISLLFNNTNGLKSFWYFRMWNRIVVRWRSMLNGKTDENKNNPKKETPNWNPFSSPSIYPTTSGTHMWICSPFYMFSNCRHSRVLCRGMVSEWTSERVGENEWMSE